MKFTCPNCSLPLEIMESGSAVCPRGHSFDRSRDGYYNLLLSAAGSSHGDNRDMLMARRRFLDTGAYLPLANRISELLADRLGGACAVLDMGCGEGYYTDIVERTLSRHLPDVSVSAFDISKDAARLAAKRNKRVSVAVASSYHIPAPDAAFDAVFNVFSPMAEAETARVLRRGGIFIFVAPDREHLWELKSHIYDAPYRNEPRSAELAGFRLLAADPLSYEMSLDGADKIADLFAMTPYSYRTTPAEKARLSSLASLKCRAEFLIFVYEKL